MNLTVRHIVLRCFCLSASIILTASFVVAASADDEIQRDQFKIGMILPLSGPAADYGQSITNAIELAKGDAPENFENIRFIYEDAMYDAKLAATAFNKLRDVEKVNVIFSWGISFCQTLAPMAEQFKVPMVAECVDEDVAKGRKYVIRLLNLKGSYTRPLLDYLLTNNKRKIAMIVAENAYLELMKQTLEGQMGTQFEFSSVERYPMNSNDFSTSITKLRASKPDAVAVFLGAGQIAQFYRQLKQQNIQLPTLGTNFFESQSEIDASRGTMDGAVYAFNSMEKDFEQRYLQRFGKATQLGFAAVAYEFAIMAGEAFHNAPNIQGEEVLNRFAVSGTRHGRAGGDFRYIDTPATGRYFEFPVVLKTIEKGKFVELHERSK